MSEILKDSRFAKYLNDPRYRQIPKHERKVKIDKRFQSMFKDEKFKVKYTVDKRGRPVNETSTENLRKYYDLEESDDASSTSEDEESESSKTKKDDDNEKSAQSDDEADEEADTSGRFVKRPSSRDEGELAEEDLVNNDKLIRGKLDKKTKKRLLDLDIDYARGEGLLQTDSSSDDDSSEEEEESDLEHEWGELDADAGSTEESTKRLAICNLDWDNIKAADIMVLLNSFLPPGGVILKVTIYPSEYGLQRMKEEEVRGPIELTEKAADDDLSDDGGNEEGSTYHMEKLRRYQLNRLKYYYAVVECDSAATADALYAECDNMEYESSATRLDMRVVPDDVTFDQEPHEVCTKLPDLAKYKPRLFTTTALQQAKVELTWDATNPNRTEAIRSAAGGDLADLDLHEYLASSSDDDDEEQQEKADKDSQSDQEEDDPIQKYKKLLLDIEQKEEKKKNKDMEMEISWGLGVKDKAQALVKQKMKEENKNLTPFEKLIEKKKEKKKQKKLERKQKLNENTSDGEQEEASDDDIPSDVDMNDPYFAEEFNKPEFKKSKDKNKKKNKPTEETEEDENGKAELELLLDDEDDGKAHFSLKKIQEAEAPSKKSRRKKKMKEKMMEQKQTLPDFEVDVNDQRFSALFNSHHYNIDPSDPNFKKTKNMERLIQEKLKRRPVDTPATEEQPAKKSREDAEMSILVKNIKRKTKDAMKK
ncbi:ESF1 homolog isoform X2 [Plutella xylostella]|uniref:ESF1 homolog isoform X2 n=1 Tax=Plutella xylostella TaxID=51655 RepID=UPI0020330A88|nr:ESF1 homolog isoform X2 [Plutella xylostella]